MNDSDQQPKLILLMSASMDGFLAANDHEMDWLTPPGPAADAGGARRHAANLELLSRAGKIVVGRRAYDDMAPFWSDSDSPMAAVINALPKTVFSATDPDFKWCNSEVSHRSVEEEIGAMKQEPGGDIVCFGGAKLAHSLVAANLIDEYRLAIHPVVFGDGLPLWLGLAEPRRFFLVSSTTYADGVISTHFTKLDS